MIDQKDMWLQKSSPHIKIKEKYINDSWKHFWLLWVRDWYAQWK